MSSMEAEKAAADIQTWLYDHLSSSRGITLQPDGASKPTSAISVLEECSTQLKSAHHPSEAEALSQVHAKATGPLHHNGLNIDPNSPATPESTAEVQFLCTAHLQALTSSLNTPTYNNTLPTRPASRHPMTLAQKIFTQHALSNPTAATTGLHVGSVSRIALDWVLASELSWSAMATTYAELGSPGIWRNDRFWLAGDHIVHPSIRSDAQVKSFVSTAEKAKRDFQLTEFQGMNYTIMHTEFVRERAEPGMMVIGSDSHTCSAGAVGCLAIGLGAADVMMGLVGGETWFKIPESIFINFTGKPAFGMTGKDVILFILKQLKRNTVAAERIVEFGGPGAKWLSVDARFAVCNMCTEFGAITGVFVPDGVTAEYIGQRRRRANRENSVYFQPDEGAEYAGVYEIDLGAVEPSVAVYPDPDHVVPVSETAGTKLDGVFIGACTTTEEELVLGALVLKIGLKKGLPMAKGKRHYVPGSLPIVQRLQELGLLEIYEEAGFTRGPPGCSMCVGLSAEKAAEGETWLSSQNRNFQNRMGKGAFGHLSSAMVCAASSFSLTITGLDEFLPDIDVAFFQHYKGETASHVPPQVTYVEPKPHEDEGSRGEHIEEPTTSSNDAPTVNAAPIKSKIITLGDFIDTDALSPGHTLKSCTTEADFAKYVLEYTHPEFRAQVAAGQRVVVAGHAFGVGSSRETAVLALKGVGVQAVIAKSFAFIYSRNQPSLGLLGIVMKDEEFYKAAKEGEEIVIDVPGRRITVAGREFEFELSVMEEGLLGNKGISGSYAKFGKRMWQKLVEGDGKDEGGRKARTEVGGGGGGDARLNW